jgi:hypothetical protein
VWDILENYIFHVVMPFLTDFFTADVPLLALASTQTLTLTHTDFNLTLTLTLALTRCASRADARRRRVLSS